MAKGKAVAIVLSEAERVELEGNLRRPTAKSGKAASWRLGTSRKANSFRKKITRAFAGSRKDQTRALVQAS